jgi:spore germination cell wall hydrolase CwlJ-like protein
MMMNFKNIVSGLITAAIVITPIVAYAKGQQDAILEAVTAYQEEQLQCLSLNIYYEARSSNLADKAAVADVVINRSHDRRYPDSICGVVHDGYKAGRRDCQFSWYCDGKSDTPKDEDRWMEAQSIAFSMMNFGDYRGITEGATHYHATYVDPFWASSLQMVGRIGQHIYYRWEEK